MIYLCQFSIYPLVELPIHFIFRKLAKNNDPSRFSSDISHEHFDSGVRMGHGAFNLV